MRWGGRRVRAARLAGTVGLLMAALVPVTGGTAVAGPPGSGGGSSSPCGDTVWKKPDGSAYVCTFGDEFEGRSLDTSKWVVQDTSKTGFHIGGACMTGSTNLKIGRGQARLSVTREDPFVCKSPAGDFVTEFRGVDISTFGKFAQTYGRFEARMAMPAATGKGPHGGFWMNPRDKAYGAWPHSGEIDVAEWYGNRPDYVHPSLHYAGRDFWEDTGWDCYIGRSDVFHDYAVEWDATVMRFYIDGKMCWSRSWVPDAPLVAPQPFDKAFFLSLSHGIGPASFNEPEATTTFPATIVVDRVRVWA